MSNRQMTPDALMAKADTACSSARALLDLGDVDGAANRAYYAMFDAARAALLASGAPVVPDIGRTHSGLIGAFSNFLVKNGPVSKEVGRLLNRAHEIRLVADYKGDSVEPADAQEIVEQAETFVATMRAEFMPVESDDNDYGMTP
ncbi:HEPN domain-containing protein [Nitrosomonas sp. ANs5]|uniref:HEPN domain-containing protein n=1 Tax=Nitrosomonas sp. ANs5 TaxID=3423941 RepID=UPI003D330AC0